MQKPELFEKESINETFVRKYFNQETEGLSLQVFPVVDSTNVLLREQAKEGAPDGTVIIAGDSGEGKTGTLVLFAFRNRRVFEPAVKTGGAGCGFDGKDHYYGGSGCQ